MKRNILTGVIILLPLAITIWIARFFFDLLTTPFMGIFKSLLHYFGFVEFTHPVIILFSRLFVLIGILFLIYFIGLIGQKILFNWLIKLTEKIFLKIPFVRTIYKVSVEITKSFFQPNAKPFKKTVLFDFPTPSSKAIGFYTGIAPSETQSSSDKMCSVFLPTAPHPVSGFLLITSESHLTDVDISTEDVFKFLISCGSYHPHENEKT